MKEAIGVEDYSDEHAKQFCRDMTNAGFDVEHYNGRFFWEGPAVRCDDPDDVESETKVPCQWGNMGRSYIVYPVESAKLRHPQEA